jgi:predicted hydrocarbon binding protein
MTDAFDFDRAWMEKFRTYLNETVGEEIRKVVIQGGEDLSAESSRLEVIEWTRQAMERLDSLVDEKTCRSILSACACQYPKANLQEIKAVYAATKDIDRVHAMFQDQFESFLRNTIGVSEEMLVEIVEMVSTTYCYCGAGFYKGIWEEILQRPVEVEVLESVLSGGEVCKIIIYLPENT